MIEGRESDSVTRKLRMGMVGGGPGAFIGEVHRKAARMDGRVEVVAGVFSSDPAKSKITGKEQNLDPKRVYASYQEMAKAEKALPESERIDFVTIATPNLWHFDIAKIFLEAGFHVVCEKPMTMTLQQARDLKKIVEKSGQVFALFHNYSGYPLVKQARHMVKTGMLGEIRKIIAEYPQGWLIDKLEDTGQKQAAWRTDPKLAGGGGCLGDIATHAEHLARYISGLELVEVCADLTIFVKGRKLDDDVNVLLHYNNGAKGVLHSSQICTGRENDLNVRIFGTKGGLYWVQENPNELFYYPADGPTQIYTRANGYLCEAAQRGTRTPTGHPEAYIEGFANLYKNITDTIIARMEGRTPSELELDFPTVDDGVKGLSFIETVIESSNSAQKWVKMK